ncbi:hypothetical protein [Corynebacterium bovis]|uniref:hypothetical protein n=1 Tax=Corynebacterium bovis TaxID=36808 RepID=UPI003138A5F9
MLGDWIASDLRNSLAADAEQEGGISVGCTGIKQVLYGSTPEMSRLAEEFSTLLTVLSSAGESLRGHWSADAEIT